MGSERFINIFPLSSTHPFSHFMTLNSTATKDRELLLIACKCQLLKHQSNFCNRCDWKENQMPSETSSLVKISGTITKHSASLSPFCNTLSFSKCVLAEWHAWAFVSVSFQDVQKVEKRNNNKKDNFPLQNFYSQTKCLHTVHHV